jgi:hypothetical protein
VALLGATAWGCARDSAPARIQLHLEVPEGVLEQPPWLTVSFETHGQVTIDPATVNWHVTPPPMAIDLQFEVPGLGPDGMTTVDVSASRTKDDSVPVLTATASVKAGTTATIDLKKPPMNGDGGMGDGGDGGNGDGGNGDGGTIDADAGPDGGAPEVHPGDGGDAQKDGDAAGADGGDVCQDDGGQDAGGPEIGVPGQTCSKYCDLMAQNCGMDLSTCQKTCTGLRWEAITDKNPVNNNLTCRNANATLAAFASMKQMACGAATWNGMATGGCGTPCDVYCDAGKVICSGAATFTNSACADACRTSLTPANRDCRVQALIDGDCPKATSGTGCP